MQLISDPSLKELRGGGLTKLELFNDAKLIIEGGLYQPVVDPIKGFVYELFKGTEAEKVICIQDLNVWAKVNGYKSLKIRWLQGGVPNQLEVTKNT